MHKINLKNSATWGAVIVSLSVDQALDYFCKVLSFYDQSQRPLLDRPLAFAFSSLLSKLSYCAESKRIKELSLSFATLKNLTSISFSSYDLEETLIVGINIMLSVAVKADMLKWAKYIYEEASKNKVSDVVTHSLAIQFFGNAKDLLQAEAAFATACRLPVSGLKASYLYAAMVQACFINHCPNRARRIYEEANQKGYANAVVRTTMIKIAGMLKDQALAQNLLKLILDDVTANQFTRCQALKHFRAYFRDQLPLSGLLVEPARAPEQKQNPPPAQVNSHSFFSLRSDAVMPDSEEAVPGVFQQLMQQSVLFDLSTCDVPTRFNPK